MKRHLCWLYILFSTVNIFALSEPAVEFSKSFSGSADPGETVTLTFTLTNPENFSISDLAFTDDLDACLSGLVATNTPLNDICGSGSQLTGTSVLTLTGGNLAANGGTASFDVTLAVPEGAAAGTYTNTTSELTYYGVPVSGPISADLVVNDTPLPVQLYDFQAIYQNNNIQLHWTVQNEIDILGYTVERKSSDSLWKQIASYQNDKELQCSTSDMQKSYNWTDYDMDNKSDYTYRLSHTDFHGEVTILKTVQANLVVPEQTCMHNAYPNPFNPQTTIQYQILKDAQVEITIYNILGVKVRQLVRGLHTAGSYHKTWDGTSDNGTPLPSGVYLIKMQTPDFQQLQKIVLTK